MIPKLAPHPERYVKAVIEYVVRLDLPPDATDEEKLEAAEAVWMADSASAEAFEGSIGHETVDWSEGR